MAALDEALAALDSEHTRKRHDRPEGRSRGLQALEEGRSAVGAAATARSAAPVDGTAALLSASEAGAAGRLEEPAAFAAAAGGEHIIAHGAAAHAEREARGARDLAQADGTILAAVVAPTGHAGNALLAAVAFEATAEAARQRGEGEAGGGCNGEGEGATLFARGSAAIAATSAGLAAYALIQGHAAVVLATTPQPILLAATRQALFPIVRAREPAAEAAQETSEGLE